MAEQDPGAQSGRLFLIKLPETAGGDTFIPVACAQENSLSYENGEVDASCKDSEFRKLIAGGTRQLNTSVNGIYISNDEGAQRLADNALSNRIETMQLVFADGETFEGMFQVGTYERTGNHQEATTFSCDLKSAGEVTHTPAGEATA